MALNKDWSARAECRYSDFGKYTDTIAEGGARSLNLSSHAVRVGVSYHFGDATSPVVAKY